MGEKAIFARGFAVLQFDTLLEPLAIHVYQRAQGNRRTADICSQAGNVVIALLLGCVEHPQTLQRVLPYYHRRSCSFHTFVCAAQL